jgi:hypothetical protein
MVSAPNSGIARRGHEDLFNIHATGRALVASPGFRQEVLKSNVWILGEQSGKIVGRYLETRANNVPPSLYCEIGILSPIILWQIDNLGHGFRPWFP